MDPMPLLVDQILATMISKKKPTGVSKPYGNVFPPHHHHRQPNLCSTVNDGDREELNEWRTQGMFKLIRSDVAYHPHAVIVNIHSQNGESIVVGFGGRLV